MAEVEIVKAQQEQSGAKSFWDSRKFAELMAYSAVDAAQFCIDCGIDTEINGINVKDIVAGKTPVVEEITTVIQELPVDEAIVDEEVPLLTKEDLQELLKANNIKFSNLTGEKKLLDIAKSNNLL
jgi:hypothetical protein